MLANDEYAHMLITFSMAFVTIGKCVRFPKEKKNGKLKGLGVPC
jgi:hypothetical protein